MGATKKYKPRTPGRRWGSVSSYEEITRSSPEKSLVTELRKTGGRNANGRKTVSRKGGGHKRRYRKVDFMYSMKNVPGVVDGIEYDPNRSAHIALVNYEDGSKGYIVAPAGVTRGSRIESGEKARIENGNSMPLKRIPLGTEICCIELQAGRGARMARSAGNSAVLEAKDSGNAHLRLPSGEVRLVREDCYATIGKVGNADHENISIGKAGRSRHMGIRPKTRAVAKNPVDHPMGGGEGKSSGGRHPVTPWGKITKGLKTRKKKKASDKMIVKRRKK
jgi:large subunit ribosomal protein L2